MLSVFGLYKILEIILNSFGVFKQKLSLFCFEKERKSFVSKKKVEKAAAEPVSPSPLGLAHYPLQRARDPEEPSNSPRAASRRPLPSFLFFSPSPTASPGPLSSPSSSADHALARTVRNPAIPRHNMAINATITCLVCAYKKPMPPSPFCPTPELPSAPRLRVRDPEPPPRLPAFSPCSGHRGRPHTLLSPPLDLLSPCAPP